ncbi:nucleolar ribonuclease P complex [Malassezia pachydermatis]
MDKPKRKSTSVVQTHTKEHTQRHKARRDGIRKKDAAVIDAVSKNGASLSRKRVFRPILTSPYAASWPQLPKVDANAILHTLLEILTETHATTSTRLSPDFTVGINAITRSLESLVQAAQHNSVVPIQAVPRFLFVCTADMDPPTMVAHMPMLTAIYNAFVANQIKKDDTTPDESTTEPMLEISTVSSTSLVLIPLPKGAEFMLSTALGVRRLSALLVHSSLSTSYLNRLEQSVQAVGNGLSQGYRLPWLDTNARLHLPHVKQVSSSAPKNMTQAKMEKKLQRKHGKQLA